MITSVFAGIVVLSAVIGVFLNIFAKIVAGIDIANMAAKKDITDLKELQADSKGHVANVQSMVFELKKN